MKFVTFFFFFGLKTARYLLLLYKTSPEDLLSKRIVLVDYGMYIKHEVVYFHFPFPYIFFYVAMITTKTLVMQHF